MTEKQEQRMDSAAAKTASRVIRPRDAATLIIVDAASGVPRVLMGRRRDDQVFMPGKYVFPGGRVDKEDRLVQPAEDLRPSEISKLLHDMKGGPNPTRARAIALAAVRETFEEAGLVIGMASTVSPPAKAANWQPFMAIGYAPSLARLTLIARAITPPGNVRRYDTRFFCVDAGAIAHRCDVNDGELSGLHWLSFDEARSLDLPSITRVVLEDLADRLKSGIGGMLDAPATYYHHLKGRFRRDLVPAGTVPELAD
jgi:8-oxo-dGTP pyrophosphatase MutT (NUDIX family)